MSEQLKRCPFCGNEIEISNRNNFVIYCKSCKLMASFAINDKDAWYEKVIAAWNRRHEPERCRPMNSEIERAIGNLQATYDREADMTIETFQLATQALREKLEREQQPEGWISVEDSLPPAEVNVLIFCEGVNIKMAYWEHDIWRDASSDWGFTGVTHWRPLPSKPNMEG